MKDDAPSATALLIARSQLLLAESGMGWALGAGSDRERYYRAFAAAAGVPRRAAALRARWLWFVESISVPGIYLHYALRKLYIERLAREFLDNASTPRQIVVIAAGFDPLLPILCREQPRASFYEIDHPATQAVKRRALHDIPANAAALTLVPVDLTRQSVGDALAQTSFSNEQPTLFVAEGITMYLSAVQVTDLIRQVKACTQHPASRFLFTYMNKSASGSIQFETATPLADIWLRLKREVFKWGIPTSDLPRFLSELECRMIRVFTRDDFVAAHPNVGGARLTRGENICVSALAP
jgi:methyltransferase (TIGR00027 family)